MNEEDEASESAEEAEDSESTLAELADIVRERQRDAEDTQTDTPAEDTPFEWVGEEADTQTEDRLETIKRDLRNAGEKDPQQLAEMFPSLSEESLDDLLREVERDIEPIFTEIEDASNILLLDASGDSQSDQCCIELLTEAPPEQSNVVFVTLTESADERLAVWRKHADTLPAEMAIITAGDHTRSTQTTSTISTGERSGTISVTTLDDPADLPRLGIVLTRTVTEWEDSPSQISVCFHSLTELLQYVDSKRLFRFIHLVQNRLGEINTTVHYHINTEAHDEQTIAVFRSLFDAVVRIDSNGYPEIVSKPS